MKFYTKKEKHRGYIPSDKVRHNGVAYESFSLGNFGIKYNGEDKKELVEMIKQTSLYSKIEKDGYHTSMYLNFNFDGVCAFISR